MEKKLRPIDLYPNLSKALRLQLSLLVTVASREKLFTVEAYQNTSRIDSVTGMADYRALAVISSEKSLDKKAKLARSNCDF